MKIPKWWPFIFLNPLTGLAAVGALVFFLAQQDQKSMEEQEKKYQAIERAMPPGCKIARYGEYRGLRDLTIVHCTGKSVTNENYMIREGKSWRQRTAADITDNH